MSADDDSPFLPGRLGWLTPAVCEEVVRSAWNQKCRVKIPDATRDDLVQNVTLAFFDAWKNKKAETSIPDPARYAFGIAKKKIAILFRPRAKREVAHFDNEVLEKAHRTDETPEATAAQADYE